MHYSMSKSTKGGLIMNMRHNTGGSVMLLSKIKTAPLQKMVGGDLGANRIVGITSTAMPNPPPSASMASVGGSLDFAKHVRSSARKMQKKGKEDSNINFVY